MSSKIYIDYLKKELERRIEKNPRYSLRAFASALDVNIGALSQILSGSRHPSFKMADKIIHGLGLTPMEQQRFLNALAKAQKKRGLKRLSKAFQVQTSNQEKQERFSTKELSVELFKVIADWYHYAILEMTYLPGFNPTPTWIAKKLGISEMEAKLAIDRLKALELLVEDQGTLIKSSGRVSTADRTLSAPALRRRQKQILEKSIYSLENHAIEKRNHSAITMAIDPAKIPEAKKKIQEFSRDLCRFLEDGHRTQVYEMQTTLIPLTQGAENE